MDEVLKEWESGFYILPVLLITLIIAFIVSVKRGKTHEVMKYFPYYTLFLLADFIAVHIAIYLNAQTGYYKKGFRFDTYLDYSFTLFELLVFFNFFYNILNNSLFKKVIVYLIVIFVSYFLYEFVTDKLVYRGISTQTTSRVYTVEAIILIIPCIFYFIQLFKKPAVVNLKNAPDFWITTGLFFFMACTLPYSLMENYLRENLPTLAPLYSIFYIFYILLFLMIIRAYLCKKIKAI